MTPPPIRRIAVFCGSSPGSDPRFLANADALGRALATRGLGVVYGGASVGCMGALANGALAARGQVIGVLPRSLAAREIAHPGLTALELVDSMHERKARMAALSDAVIALPGGYGTFDELFEALTWSQLGIDRKPIGLLDDGGVLGTAVDVSEFCGRRRVPQVRQPGAGVGRGGCRLSAPADGRRPRGDHEAADGCAHASVIQRRPR